MRQPRSPAAPWGEPWKNVAKCSKTWCKPWQDMAGDPGMNLATEFIWQYLELNVHNSWRSTTLYISLEMFANELLYWVFKKVFRQNEDTAGGDKGS